MLNDSDNDEFRYLYNYKRNVLSCFLLIFFIIIIIIIIIWSQICGKFQAVVIASFASLAGCSMREQKKLFRP